MKTNNLIVAVCAFCLLGAAPVVLAGESLLEFYSNTSSETLNSETKEMGQKLKGMFNQQDVSSKQRDIDFAEYYSNLQKSIFYGAKLAKYSEYEQDLEFARDKELFKGLPDSPSSNSPDADRSARKGFVSKKFERMSGDVAEEIAIYEDLIHQALDACQSTSNSDLTGILGYPSYVAKIKKLTEGNEYQDYQKTSSQLASRWSAMSSIIEQQFALWAEPGTSLDSPIINPALIGVL